MSPRGSICFAVMLCSACGGAGTNAPPPEDEQAAPAAEAPTLTASREHRAGPKGLRGMGEAAESPPKAVSECDENAPLPASISADASVETLRASGRSFLERGMRLEALTAFLAAEKKAPNDPTVLSDLSLAFMQCKLKDAALDRAEKAAAAAPDNVDIVSNLGEMYRIAGWTKDAIRVLQDAVKRGIADAAVYNNLAVLLLSEGDPVAAEAAVRKATDLDHDNARFLVNLGYILMRQKRLTDAEMVLRRAVEMSPDDPDVHNQLGVILSMQKREVEAEKCFKKALELDPNHKAAKENLGAADGRPFQFDK